ncbi:MAG: type I methionyl aminopeptidase [Fimbriimonadales bacterium]|nr:type I methionyl aminopeptidase [Fimbriimonadales bacterium]
MITLKTPEQIDKMRAAGRLLAKALRCMGEAIVPGKTTTADLDALAEEIVRSEGGVPAFKGYRGFPASVCASVNEEVVHGIPSPERVLRHGDIVGLDLGVTLDGWNADAAWTFAVGEVAPEVQRLLNVTRESLFQGIAKAKAGNRIGDVAAAIQRYVEKNGYSVVRDLVGHGIGRSIHEEPSVPNFGKPGQGPVLREGMTICIEPMVNMGTWKVRTLQDQWTMVAADGKPSAHFEHTVAITKNGPLILTLP